MAHIADPDVTMYCGIGIISSLAGQTRGTSSTESHHSNNNPQQTISNNRIHNNPKSSTFHRLLPCHPSHIATCIIHFPSRRLLPSLEPPSFLPFPLHNLLLLFMRTPIHPSRPRMIRGPFHPLVASARSKVALSASLTNSIKGLSPASKGWTRVYFDVDLMRSVLRMTPLL